ncbi:MAG: hypothetical protein AB7W59_10365 [Acidimicrobiia bacterium]
MPTKAGERLKFETGTAEVVVTKGGDGTIEFDPAGAGALQVGKRYTDEGSGIEVLVTKPGSGALKVNGAEMTQVQPKQTKSAD